MINRAVENQIQKYNLLGYSIQDISGNAELMGSFIQDVKNDIKKLYSKGKAKILLEYRRMNANREAKILADKKAKEAKEKSNKILELKKLAQAKVLKKSGAGSGAGAGAGSGAGAGAGSGAGAVYEPTATQYTPPQQTSDQPSEQEQYTQAEEKPNYLLYGGIALGLVLLLKAKK